MTIGELTQSDPRYQSDVELAWLDRDGTITAVNGAWRTFCAENDGDPTACGPGNSYLDVCDADPRAAPVADAIRGQLSGSLLHPAVFTVPCDGPLSARWYNLHVSPRLSEAGEAEGVLVALAPVTPTLSDLTSDLPVSDLVEGTPDGALLVDAEGAIRYVNGQLLALTGHPRSALLGAPVEILVPEELRSRHRGWRAGFQQHPRGRPMGTGVTLSLQCYDGSRIPVEISLAPVTVGDEALTFASVRDVSEIRAQDQARRRLIDMLDLDPDAVYLVDAETAQIEYASIGATSLLGYSHDELLAMTFWEVSPNASEDGRRDRLLEHERLGPRHVHVGEVVRRAKDGKEIICDSRAQLVREPDGRSTFIVVDRDARPRLAAERELEIQIELSRLVAEVAQLVLSDASTAEVLRHVTVGAAALLDSQNASIVTYDPHADRLETLAAVGPAASLHLHGEVELDKATLLAWMAHDEPVTVPGPPTSMPSALRDRVGPGVLVRLLGTGRPLGVLTAFRAPGRPEFTSADARLLSDLAQQVTLALELGSSRAASQRLELVEERQRIARDLHDMVVQDLIGIGMQLAGRDGPDEVRQPDQELVGQLDDTIRRLRLVVFDARSTTRHGSTADEIHRTIREAARTLDHRPKLRVDDAVDALPPDLVAHLLSVLREGLERRPARAGQRERGAGVGDPGSGGGRDRGQRVRGRGPAAARHGHSEPARAGGDGLGIAASVEWPEGRSATRVDGAPGGDR